MFVCYTCCFSGDNNIFWKRSWPDSDVCFVLFKCNFSFYFSTGFPPPRHVGVTKRPGTVRGPRGGGAKFKAVRVEGRFCEARRRGITPGGHRPRVGSTATKDARESRRVCALRPATSTLAISQFCQKERYCLLVAGRLY